VLSHRILHLQGHISVLAQAGTRCVSLSDISTVVIRIFLGVIYTRYPWQGQNIWLPAIQTVTLLTVRRRTVLVTPIVIDLNCLELCLPYGRLAAI
jgi:hypothetical protein